MDLAPPGERNVRPPPPSYNGDGAARAESVTRNIVVKRLHLDSRRHDDGSGEMNLAPLGAGYALPPLILRMVPRKQSPPPGESLSHGRRTFWLIKERKGVW